MVLNMRWVLVRITGSLAICHRKIKHCYFLLLFLNKFNLKISCKGGKRSTEFFVFLFRYGKIQKVIINGPKEQRDDKEKDEKPVTKTATVAFTDIKSASNAHKAEKKIGNNLLTSEYSEGFAASGTLVTRTHEPEIFPRAPGYPNRKG